MEGLITTIQRMSLHDGPGIRSTLFLKGCNFRCRWCHNPETWSHGSQLQYIESRCIGCHDCAAVCKSGALTIEDGALRVDHGLCRGCGACAEECASGALSLVGRRVSVDTIVEELLVDKLFYDESGGGVTISGGEPFCQPHFLQEVIKGCKAKGLNVAVETNLSASRALLQRAQEYVDHWFIDIKSTDEELHREWIGCSCSRTIENLRWLAAEGVSITVRTPIVMGFNDSLEQVKAICDLLESCSISRYELLPFHKLGFDKFTQIGQKNPLSDDAKLDMELFEQLKSYVNERFNR